VLVLAAKWGSRDTRGDFSVLGALGFLDATDDDAKEMGASKAHPGAGAHTAERTPLPTFARVWNP
jgi:hypothetical protein